MKALRDVAKLGEVVKSGESVHGEKYVVDGWLSAHTQWSRQCRSGQFGSSTAAGMPRGS